MRQGAVTFLKRNWGGSVADEILRICLDTNTVLRALIRTTSHSAKILSLCETRRIVLLLSRPVLKEYRRILTGPALISRALDREPPNIKSLLDGLRYEAEYIDPVIEKFDLDRDPDDAKFIELAFAGRATHIITHDKDLLSLPTSRSDAGKRFRQRLPGVRVMDAETFVRKHPSLFGR